MYILTVNAGSSSLRLVLFRKRANELERLRTVHFEDPAVDSRPVIDELLKHAPGGLRAVVHRIVHGGTRGAPCFIDPQVEKEIAEFSLLAPLHNPPALRCLHELRAALDPAVPHIAVFDTAFFHELPAVAARYPLPPQPGQDHDLRRYGFHGSAHRAMLRAWRGLRPQLTAGGRIITLQLGAGCSITAILNGRAIDTSMGFTPLEGLMMATRCGDIDPGLLLHIQRTVRLDADGLERLLTRESGLAGVSGISGDMRDLLASREPRAKLAIDMFCYRARKYIGAYLAVLGGADAILFGGGIGEHSSEVRRRILHGLDGLGIVLDGDRNENTKAGAGRIHADGGAIEIHVIEVDEARELAIAAAELVDAC